MDSVIEGRVRAFWEQAFNGRALDLIAAITAPGFVNHNALPGTPPGPEGHRQVLERCASSTADNGQDQGRLMSRVRPPRRRAGQMSTRWSASRGPRS